MGKRAIVLGSTGLTGGHLVRLLLDDSRYDSVVLINRSRSGFSHVKIEEQLIDFSEMEKHAALFKGDELFCCIGTTKAKTPDKSNYRKIDFDIPVNAAKLAKANGFNTIVVMSSMGANPNSSVFYSKLKGEMEEAIEVVGIKNTGIVRPSIISGERNEKRLGENIMKRLMNLISPLLVGALRAYRPISPNVIAKGMLVLANSNSEFRILESDELQQIANEY